MKKFFILMLVMIAVLFAGALIFIPKGAPPATSTTTTLDLAVTVTPEARPAQKVITLFQKGEGESDLSAYVARGLSAELKGRVVFTIVDVQEEPQIAEYYNVDSVPTLIFISPTGKIFHRHEGYLSKDAILKILSSAGRV